MKLDDSRVVVTGACGGIGQTVVQELLARGAKVGMVDRRGDALRSLQAQRAAAESRAAPILADITHADGRDHIVRSMHEYFGGIDMLVNNAGIMAFTDFAHQDTAEIELMMKINVTAPMQLVRAVLPDMIERGSGRIVNVGSILGSIAFPWHSAYSASKFALRGFSEALRRELSGTGVEVTYVAPRAVRTTFNSPAVFRMAKEVNMKMDNPEVVGRRIVQAIESGSKDVYLGFPESLYARLNQLWPRLIDRGLRRQGELMRRFITHP